MMNLMAPVKGQRDPESDCVVIEIEALFSFLGRGVET